MAISFNNFSSLLEIYQNLTEEIMGESIIYKARPNNVEPTKVSIDRYSYCYHRMYDGVVKAHKYNSTHMCVIHGYRSPNG